MDAWDQAGKELVAMLKYGWHDDAKAYHIWQTLKVLERQLKAQEATREPAGICRTCGQRVEK